MVPASNIIRLDIISRRIITRIQHIIAVVMRRSIIATENITHHDIIAIDTNLPLTSTFQYDRMVA